MVGLLKQLLIRILGRACLSYEEMLTLLCDCEATVNSRSITYVSNDPKDLRRLTPSMFLQDVKEMGMPDYDGVNRCDFNKRLQYRQKLKEDLRRRFRSEYLGHLSYGCQAKRASKIRIGDVVLIGIDNQKRIDWPLPRVIGVIRGKDDGVRVVRLKTARGELTRPIQRVYPLETEDNERSVMLPHVVPEIVAEGSAVETSPPREKIVTNSGRVGF